MSDSRVYRLDEQVGFVLRQAQQRHTTLFSELMIEDLTPTQWAALAKLAERGPQSQNQLGRLTAMDAATIKGVIERLTARGFTQTHADPEDARRLLVELSEDGIGGLRTSRRNRRRNHRKNALPFVGRRARKIARVVAAHHMKASDIVRENDAN